MATYLVDTIRLLKRNPEAMLSALVDSYYKDYGTFARGNNRTPLEAAAKLLQTSKLDKAIKQGLSDGQTAGGLVNGYVGAVSGKWADQTPEKQAPFIEAIDKATAAFRVTLTASGLFNEKPELTKEEREAKKEEREAKKAQSEEETKKAIIGAAILAGEIVRAEDVVAGASLGDAALIDILCDRITAKTMEADDIEMLFSVVLAHADHDTLNGVLLGMGYAPTKKATVKKAKADTVTA